MIQYYDHNTQTFLEPQTGKVKKLIELKRIIKVHSSRWLCLPIDGYNTRTYNLVRNHLGEFDCNCQGYRKKGSCSHKQALIVILQQIGDMPQGDLFAKDEK